MYRSLPVFAVFFAAIFLHLHGANSQEKGTMTCTTEKMRRAVVDEQLAALGCDNYACGINKV